MRGHRCGRIRSAYRGKGQACQAVRAEKLLLMQEYLNTKVKKYIWEKFNFEVEFNV